MFVCCRPNMTGKLYLSLVLIILGINAYAQDNPGYYIDIHMLFLTKIPFFIRIF